jgi:predicted ArsR family transcriptional regulator
MAVQNASMTSPLLRHRVLAGLTRSRILAVLRHTDGAVGVREVARVVGLHPNSVRDQLDLLVDAGLVTRSTARPAGRGRPSYRYTAVPEPGDPDANAYRELARVLADELAQQPEPVPGAIRAGERWGRQLAADVPHTPDDADAAGRLIRLLDEAGFAPERAADTADAIHLRRCPFASVATLRPDVVCSVHLGLMRGALRVLGSPLDAVALEPFVAPDLCIARLGPS